jgi:hypothetical protein
MKKALIAITALAITAASASNTRAHDGGWSTAGKVLTGVGAGLLISQALEPHPVYIGAPVYVAPTPVVVQQPATVVVQQPVQQVISQPVQTVQTVQPVQTVQQVQPVQTVQPAPVVVQQQPVTVVQQPVVQQPVIVQQPAVVYQPAPVVYAPARVVYGPPVVGFRFSFGRPYYHHRHW